MLALAFLLDVLEPITKLSKVFQGDLIDISILRPAVDSTIAVLEVLQTSDGPQLKQVYYSIQNCTKLSRLSRLCSRSSLLSVYS